MLEIQKKQYGCFSVCFILISSIQADEFTQTKVLSLLLISDGPGEGLISLSALH